MNRSLAPIMSGMVILMGFTALCWLMINCDGVSGMRGVSTPLGEQYVVSYEEMPMPSREELQTRSGFKFVSALYDDRTWSFTPGFNYGDGHAAGLHSFLAYSFGARMSADQVLAWARTNGLRPATHKEAYEFSRFSPSVMFRTWVTALGSSTLNDYGQRCVSRIGISQLGVTLDAVPLEGDWFPSTTFLFVSDTVSMSFAADTDR